SLLLGDALAEDVIHIIFAQGLLETRFSSWVDAFPDQQRPLSKADRLGIGGDHRAFFRLQGGGEDRFAALDHCRNVRRGGSTTAARKPSALADQFLHHGGKFFRTYVKYRAPIHTA